MEFVIGQKVNHKVFGTGVVVNVIDKPSGSASHEQYVDVEFDEATVRPTDHLIHAESPVYTRRFSFASLEKFLTVEEE